MLLLLPKPVLPSKMLPFCGLWSPATLGSKAGHGRVCSPSPFIGGRSTFSVVLTGLAAPERAVSSGPIVEARPLFIWFSLNFADVGVFPALFDSTIPSWLRLRSPMPNVFTAGSFASESLLILLSSIDSTSTSSIGVTIVSCVLLLVLCCPGRVVLMLLVRVFAAFCAAEKTDEKKPVCCEFPGVTDPFSGVGVRGADVIFDSLLGPILLPLANDPERMRLCDIMFPDGDVTTFGFVEIGEPEKRGEAMSVGVGGVLTIAGADAALSIVVGGVLGRPFVSILYGIFGFFSRSGDASCVCTSAGSGCCCGDCLSGKIEPSRAATLPRLFILELDSFSLRTGVEPLDFRSGLELGLGAWRGVNASLSLPTGDADRFGFSSWGACRDAVVRAGMEAVEGREGCEGRAAGDFVGDVVALDCSAGGAL